MATATIPNSSALPATAGGNAADAAVAFARSQIGKPYQWGATGPNAYDCSGLVQQSYKAAGINLPRTTYTQIAVGQAVDKASLGIGDLVFPDPGHVQLYSGNGNVIEAPHTGLNVREVPMWGFWQARRVTVPGTSAATSATLTSINLPPGVAPLVNPLDAIPKIWNSVQSIEKAIAAIGTFATFISNPLNWLRVFEFALGLGLLGIGFAMFMKLDVGKAINTAGKVANAANPS